MKIATAIVDTALLDFIGAHGGSRIGALGARQAVGTRAAEPNHRMRRLRTSQNLHPTHSISCRTGAWRLS
jgi:hypothetical protein